MIGKIPDDQSHLDYPNCGNCVTITRIFLYFRERELCYVFVTNVGHF